MKNAFYWTPRILMILFIFFISLFAFDAFDGNQTILNKIGAFLIHLIPSAVLVILLIISWKREWIGGIIFFLLGIFYIVTTWGKFPLMTYVFISGPLFLVAILFGINWINRDKTIGKNTGHFSVKK